MDDNFIAIDVETAQGKRWSICQIGLAIVENGKIVKTVSQLVQPPGNEYFHFNVKIHKITPKMTANSPYFPEVWKEIYPFIENKKLVAHNASFDISCLNQVLDFYNLEKPNFDYDCTYKLSGQKLKDACRSLDINLKNHHDASCDANACAQIYLKLLNEKDLEFSQTKTKNSITNKKSNSTQSNKLNKKINSNIKPISSKLNEQTIVISGIFENHSRDELKELIVKYGGKNTGSISAKTNYLLAGKNTGSSKLEKVKKLKIPIISEEEFIGMIKD